MSDWSSLASIGNILVSLMLLIGGYIALRSGKQRQASEIQGQVIDALKAELETLQRRIEALEKENTRQTQMISLIKIALNKRGIAVTIDGDIVTISDSAGVSSTIRQFHTREEQA